jgi:hypothetical protein
MGSEMIKDKLVITPQRMFALACLVHSLGSIPRDQLLVQLQPKDVSDNRDAANLVYRYAKRYRLICEGETTGKLVTLGVAPYVIASFETFRCYMQSVLLGVTNESQDDFLLGQFTAWYAVQDHRVMVYSKTDLEAKFHDSMYPSAPGRVLAEEPGISAWRTWAGFLGWGWGLKFEARDEMHIVPDAACRIRPLLPQLLPTPNIDIPMSDFMTGLGVSCPELDGGTLFNSCWEASRGGEERGNRISLMVSTALRTLDAVKAISLIERKDASVIWTLFPAQSHISRVTDIRREVLG